jgi:hypothetical protein
VPAYAPADMAAQMYLARKPLAAFRPPPRGQRICRPVFVGSADADFILGRLLLGCKATSGTVSFPR